MASEYIERDIDILSNVSTDHQIKIVSWFLYQEGSVLPEIVTRLSQIYGSATVDIVSVTLFLQSLKPDTAKDVESFAETLLEDIDPGGLIDTVADQTEQYTVIEDLLEGENDDIHNILPDEPASEKKHFRSRKKVMCKFCGKVIVNKYTLDSHIVNHHSESARSCGICGKVYGLNELLNKHLRVKHDSSERVELPRTDKNDGKTKKLGWKCSTCQKVFQTRKALEIHSYVHSKQSEIFCDICGKSLRNPVTLKRHKANFHGEQTKFSCHICSYKCFSRPTLTEHLGTHGLPCKTCSEIFQSAEDLDLHSSVHKKFFDCVNCLKSFSTDDALKRHIKCIHSKERLFPCTKCSENFLSKPELKLHRTMAHNVENKTMFVCDTCGKPYASSTKLKYHILYEHQHLEKPFQCDVCHKRFAFKPDQKRHMERHSAEPKYQCEVCQKKFFTSNDKLRHFRIVHENYHAGSCEVCGRRFQTVGGREWTQHMNSHAGIKNISCPLCSKTFFTDETLKCHMISHFDTMYWSCGLCSKNFKRLKNVKYHLRSVHTFTDTEEIRAQCVKLRSPPTKAEIQQMCESRINPTDNIEISTVKTDFALADLKNDISTTFELTL